MSQKAKYCRIIARVGGTRPLLLIMKQLVSLAQQQGQGHNQEQLVGTLEKNELDLLRYVLTTLTNISNLGISGICFRIKFL